MKLCLDEHYSAEIAVELRKKGHDVCAVTERPELIGLGDGELLARAAAERRALLTENVADFAPIVRQTAAVGESHYGIIYSSPRSMPRSRSTIGQFVNCLNQLLQENRGDEDLRDRSHWLEP